eukprot:357798-Chlamydomonas_euryale.AAC.6
MARSALAQAAACSHQGIKLHSDASDVKLGARLSLRRRPAAGGRGGLSRRFAFAPPRDGVVLCAATDGLTRAQSHKATACWHARAGRKGDVHLVRLGETAGASASPCTPDTRCKGPTAVGPRQRRLAAGGCCMPDAICKGLSAVAPESSVQPLLHHRLVSRYAAAPVRSSKATRHGAKPPGTGQSHQARGMPALGHMNRRFLVHLLLHLVLVHLVHLLSSPSLRTPVPITPPHEGVPWDSGFAASVRNASFTTSLWSNASVGRAATSNQRASRASSCIHTGWHMECVTCPGLGE